MSVWARPGGGTVPRGPDATAATRAMLRDHRRRALLVGGVLAGLAVALAMLALMLGDYRLSPAQVIHALGGADEGFAGTVVREWRLPRLVAALLFGAALAVSGSVFQTLTGNPLGSPDVLGISSGSFTGALLAIVLVDAGLVATAVGAMLGAGVAAAAILLLGRTRGVASVGFVLTGVAVMLFFTAVNTAIVQRADREVALGAASWGAGSIGTITLEVLLPVAAALMALGAVVGLGARDLRQLHLGSEVATATGVHVRRSVVVLLSAGAALTAVVSAVCGPIVFISLAAPQIARRLGPWAPAPLWLSGLVGAVLLLAADLLAQHLFDPIRLPVGVVTACLGGGYLIWLIVREARRS